LATWLPRCSCETETDLQSVDEFTGSPVDDAFRIRAGPWSIG